MPDSGIYILKTFDERITYRVALCHNIENIYGEYNSKTEKYAPNPQILAQYFYDAKVFLDIENAIDYAQALDNELELTDNGVCLVTEFGDYSFSDFKEQTNGKDQEVNC